MPDEKKPTDKKKPVKDKKGQGRDFLVADRSLRPDNVSSKRVESPSGKIPLIRFDILLYNSPPFLLSLHFPYYTVALLTPRRKWLNNGYEWRREAMGRIESLSVSCGGINMEVWVTECSDSTSVLLANVMNHSPGSFTTKDYK
jgi:hypothetical protein